MSRVSPPLRCCFGGGGFYFRVPVSAGGPLLAGGGGGKGCTNGRVVPSSPCVVGWCGVVPQLWVCFFFFRGVRRLVRVRPTVSVPCLGAVVCFGVPCCAVLCFSVLRRAVLRCAVVRPALPCRAVPCRAVVCPAVSWRVAPCCAASRCVPHCSLVWSADLSRCAALRCVVLQCTLLRRALSCFALLWCVVGPPYLRLAVGWRRRWLDWWLCCVRRWSYVACWLSGSVVLCGAACWVCISGVWVCVRSGGSGGCPRGCLGPVSSGGPCP